MRDSYDKVFRSPLNKSPSKQLYSFPKAQRFPNRYKLYTQTIYYPKNWPTEKSFVFGHSKRLQDNLVGRTPSPNKYKIKTQFDKNNELHKGFSFGSAKRLGTQYEKFNTNETPGPGTYNYKIDKYINLAFSMGKRHEDLALKNSNPVGPGQYNNEISSLNLTGSYFNSKYRSSCCSKINNSPRFRNNTQKTPGPGQYQANRSINLSKQGNYFNSKFKSSKAVKFSQSQRLQEKQRSVSPGPGTYHNFSQFGRRNKSTYKL